MFDLSNYFYDLPDDRIAQTPCGRRSQSKLMRINRAEKSVTHHQFEDIQQMLSGNDLLVLNNTKVVPARLLGKKETGGKIEVLIIDYAGGMTHLKETGYFMSDCLVKASISPKQGDCLLFDNNVRAVVEDRNEGIFCLRFLNKDEFPIFLERFGKIPLPPYIQRGEDRELPEDRENYQTVYAAREGAVAAPTAGLHFSRSLMTALADNGVEFAPVTLHVGYGTFVPVKVKDIRDHKIHSEYVSLSPSTAEKINQARELGKKIIAVGTTSVRTLEFLSDDDGLLEAQSGMCDLFIYPGYRFKCVDAMITNFHLPGSTLLMLVSAFYNRAGILDAYRQAIENGYRFFSYGDAMLIE